MTGNNDAHQTQASINKGTWEPAAFPEDSVWCRGKNLSVYKRAPMFIVTPTTITEIVD